MTDTNSALQRLRPLMQDRTTGQWFFFDREGYPHYYPTKEEADAALRLVWG